MRFLILAEEQLNPSENEETSAPEADEALPDTPGMAGRETAEKIQARRRRRNIAAIVLSVALLGFIGFTIAAFLGRVSGNFAVALNPRNKSDNLSLSLQADSDKTSTLLADGIANANPAASDQVFDYLDDNVFNQDNLGGSYNAYWQNGIVSGSLLSAEKGEEAVAAALVYVFYLHNNTEEALTYTYQFSISEYVAPINEANEPYEYLRIALYRDSLADDGSSEGFEIYGYQSLEKGTVDGGKEDTRECVSKTMKTKDEEGNVLRYPSLDLTRPESKGYCTPFYDETGVIIRDQALIAPKATVRYCIVSWLEGNDAECSGAVPEGASMTFQMEFDG